MTLAAADQQTEQQSPAPESGDSTTLETLVGAWDKAPADEGATGDVKPDADKPKPEGQGEKPKPEGKPADQAKPADEKPADEKQDAGTKPPPKLFQAHEQLKKTVKTIEQERDQLRQKVTELEKSKGPDPKEVEALRKELEETRAELREAAFERSPDYKKIAVEQRQELYDTAIADITGNLMVTVKGTDANGDETVTERPATEADFRRIWFLPPREQDKAILDMFGPSAQRVHTHLALLAQNTRQAQAALQEARKSSEERSKQTQQQAAQAQQQYQDGVSKSMKALEEKWPHWFKAPPVEGENADKELAAAHASGLALVNDFEANAGKLSIEDAAAQAAVIKSRASSWPRLVVELRRALEKVQSYENRLKGREKSDPGAGGDTKPAGGGSGAQNDGIEGMAAEWDKTS